MASNKKASPVAAELYIPGVTEPSGRSIGPQAGWQTKVWNSDVDEILAGGEKGSGKSFFAGLWLIRGNTSYDRTNPHPIDLTYINCPSYYAVALRRNADDLRQWADEIFREVYQHLGATYHTDPHEFRFPSGAKIALGHLADDHAWQKHTGKPMARLFIDEVTYIKSEEVYNHLFSSVRSSHEKIKPQILLTGNPVGPGVPWVEKRFVHVTGPNGKLVAYGTTMKFPSRDPLTREVKYMSRMYVPTPMRDNLIFLKKNPDYAAKLNTLPEPMRSQLLFGDWNARRDRFFPDLRLERRPDEPEHAVHLVPSEAAGIEPWYPRIVAMDWGYTHHSTLAVGAVKPNGQLVIYKARAERQVNAEEAGRRIARWLEPELLQSQDHTLTIYVSPDIFPSKLSDMENCRVMQIQRGINDVLGPNATYLEERKPEEETEAAFDKRIEALSSKCRVTLRRAYRSRVDGWEQMRTLLNWRHFAEELLKPNEATALRILHEHGADAYSKYMQQYTKEKPALPRLLFTDNCAAAAKSLSSAQPEESNPDDVKKCETLDDDYLDMLRYLCMAYKRRETRMPIKQWVDERFKAWASMNPNAGSDIALQVKMHLWDTRGREDKTAKSKVMVIRTGPRNAGVYAA